MKSTILAIHNLPNYTPQNMRETVYQSPALMAFKIKCPASKN